MTPSNQTHMRQVSHSVPARWRFQSGFTLIEILVVMTMIAMLLTLAVPRYFSALDNGRLRVQQQNVATLRDSIDKFHADQGRYPEDLEEIVTKKYLRQIPIDPVSGTTNWVLVAPTDDSEGNVYDVQPAESLPNLAAEGQ